MRLGRSILICLLAAGILAPAAFAAPGFLLGKGSDDGLPLAFAKADAVRPKALFMRITTFPEAPVEVAYDTNCSKKKKGRVRHVFTILPGRSTIRLRKGFKRPDDCLFDAIAGYVDAAQEGKIRIELFARFQKRPRR